MSKLPESLRKILSAQNPKSEPKGEVTIIWRNGDVLREHPNGRVEVRPPIRPIP